MSVDISDPRIQQAYAAIVRGDAVNWLILSYANTRDTLTLLATGTGGIEELQRTLQDDDAYFALVREQDKICLINFFPSSISGVRRARALVHARAVTSLFKASNVTLTVQNAHQVEISAIRAKLGLDRLPLYEKAPRAANGLPPNRASQSSAVVAETPTPRAQSPASLTSTRSSRLPQYTGSSLARKEEEEAPPTPTKPPTVLRRISAQEKRDAPLPPPPPPAEDADDYEIVNAPIVTANAIAARLRGVSMADSMFSDNQSQYSTDTAYKTSRIRGLSETSYTYREESTELGYLSGDTTYSRPLFLTEAQEQAALSRARWAEEREEIGNPHRRGRTKSDLQREREQEEIEMARAAAEAAARRKYEKEQQALQEAEEEERKKVAFQEAQRRRAADRLRREQLRREEEERERIAAEERRRAAQERRLEEARKAEERRLEEKRRQEERERREEERRRAAESERLARMKEIQRRFDSLRLTAGVLLTGYVSIQPGTSIVWRRRFFQLQSDCMLFYKNAEETHTVIDSFELKGYVTGIKEWHQGYDDLRAIPHSFAIEFMDEPAWMMFADSEEDKDVLVSLITQLSRV
ncbi:hypothetical protein PIIN_00542 [Serendipita indica DSM 11827]|uniref:ADF-H domain-containing protein n=1 Tax=Serendipita indica (strain DSM 11827) TaxID=1109443 RepID=G4U2Q9_SERID|nr:hypothetical protein PIIN_00542 [Serendipita indica DSM 11827]